MSDTYEVHPIKLTKAGQALLNKPCLECADLKERLLISEQTKGEYCEECGWSMKFEDEPCRCELVKQVEELKGKLTSVKHPHQDLVDYFLSHTEEELISELNDCIREA